VGTVLGDNDAMATIAVKDPDGNVLSILTSVSR